jgi:hypothetical protein
MNAKTLEFREQALRCSGLLQEWMPPAEDFARRFGFRLEDETADHWHHPTIGDDGLLLDNMKPAR